MDACSFFKINASLLIGSSSNNNATTNNNIERNAQQQQTNCVPTASTNSEAATCRTCFNVRRRRLHPPTWAATTSNFLCDCNDNFGCSATTSDIILPTQRSDGICPGLSQQLGLLSKLKLHSEEFCLIGMPVYDAKRTLVEKVVEGVAEIARGASAIVLWSALERLLADGLIEGFSAWNVIEEITMPGKKIFCKF